MATATRLAHTPCTELQARRPFGGRRKVVRRSSYNVYGSRGKMRTADATRAYDGRRTWTYI